VHLIPGWRNKVSIMHSNIVSCFGFPWTAFSIYDGYYHIYFCCWRNEVIIGMNYKYKKFEHELWIVYINREQKPLRYSTTYHWAIESRTLIENGSPHYGIGHTNISWLGHDNTIFYLMRTKQCCYYLNPFHESIFFRIYAGFTVILMSAPTHF
jgi:hypothetical protein